MVTRIVDGIAEVLTHIVADETLNAVDKFKAFYAQANQWKVEHREAVLQAAEIMYNDSNVVLRDKIIARRNTTFSPLLAKVIQQGIEEGVFNVTYPYETAELILLMPQHMGEQVVTVLLAENRDAQGVAYLKRQINAFNQATERVLGVPDGALTLINTAIIDEWL